MKYILDTNVFNDVLDGNIDIECFRKQQITCCVTHIQRDEINNTTNEERRKALKEVFSDLVTENYLTETAIRGTSRYNGAKRGDGELFQEIKARMDELNPKKNNTNDALIGETAIKNSLTLITRDKDFLRVMTEKKCATADISQVIKSDCG